MSGCDFEKKSFTVPLSSGKKKELCENKDCKNPLGKTIFKVKGKRVCLKCWEKPNALH